MPGELDRVGRLHFGHRLRDNPERVVVAPRLVFRRLAVFPRELLDIDLGRRRLDEMVARRVAFLTDYQDAAYAARYRRWVEKAKAVEAARMPGNTGLADAVARYLFKLMAYKDEYEVARLYADESFAKQVKREVGGEHLRLFVHLAPPLLARRDKVTGEPKKITFGPWIFPLFRLVAKFKFLRGTPFDPFGYSTERKVERSLVRDYEAMLEEVLARLNHVKARHLKAAKADEAALLDQLRAGVSPLLKAAE